jgi:small-conductance mechanosensitive channel
MTSSEKSAEISKLRAALGCNKGELQRVTDDNALLAHSLTVVNTMANDAKEQLMDCRGQLEDVKAKLHSVLYCMSYYTAVGSDKCVNPDC